jgi:hypothetical protein
MTTTELTGAEDVAWDLSDLYESGDDPRLDADVAAAERPPRFRDRYYGIAELTPQTGAAIESGRMGRLRAAIYYAHLWFSTDMNDRAARSSRG